MPSGKSLPAPDEIARDVRRKIMRHLQLPFVILIVLSSLDRVNISFAALQMNKALGLTPQSFGAVGGVFFIGYILFQFPSAALHRRLGTRLWIATIVGCWGLIATAMAAVPNIGSLFVLRFLLGAAEAGLTPGIVFISVSWMPRRFRAEAIAATLLAIPVSVIIGGPLSGWLMSQHNPLGLAGWRWMFLLEGLPTLAMAGVALGIFTDRPGNAKWLTPGEKQWLQQELNQEARDTSAQPPVPIGRLVTHAPLWASAGIWFATLLGTNGIILWLPQALKQISGASDLAIGMLSTLPWIGVGIGMLANAWHSDRTQERYGHLIGAILLGAAGLALAGLAGHSWWAMVFLILGGVGIGAAQSIFWAIPGQLIGPAGLAGAITFINLIGNFASLVGPWLIGALRQQSGSFAAPIYCLALALALGAVMLAPLRRHLEGTK